MRRILAIQAMLLILLVSGCAKRPATSQSSAPAPGGSTGTTASRVQGVPTAPGGASRAASRTDGTTVRPAPREFTAIAALRDIGFDFDKYEIRPGDAKILEANAAWMRANAKHLILIEGHCDQRGTDEYNLALGERRAKATMNHLVALGVRANRVTIVSYGEERPLCAEHNDACWDRNRRAHFLVKPE